jgi:hypothetical protein
MSEDERVAYAKMTIDKQKPVVISAVSGQNIDLLVRKLWEELSKKP